MDDLQRATDNEIITALRTDLHRGAVLVVADVGAAGPTEAYEKARARELLEELLVKREHRRITQRMTSEQRSFVRREYSQAGYRLTHATSDAGDGRYDETWRKGSRTVTISWAPRLLPRRDWVVMSDDQYAETAPPGVPVVHPTKDVALARVEEYVRAGEDRDQFSVKNLRGEGGLWGR